MHLWVDSVAHTGMAEFFYIDIAIVDVSIKSFTPFFIHVVDPYAKLLVNRGV